MVRRMLKKEKESKKVVCKYCNDFIFCVNSQNLSYAKLDFKGTLMQIWKFHYILGHL